MCIDKANIIFSVLNGSVDGIKTLIACGSERESFPGFGLLCEAVYLCHNF